MFSKFIKFIPKPLSFNKIINTLIATDFILLTGFGFIFPIFAIFITNHIQGGDLGVVGFAASTYWIVLSLVLIPAGKYLDKKHGEKDDLYFIIAGNALGALAVFGFIFAHLPWHIYALQGLYAIGMGINIPGYTAIFTRHVDKGKEASSWSARAALVGIGAGVAGTLGAIIAKHFGFTALFAGVSIFILISAILPVFIKIELLKKID